jgi:hypothetical protein
MDDVNQKQQSAIMQATPSSMVPPGSANPTNPGIGHGALGIGLPKKIVTLETLKDAVETRNIASQEPRNIASPAVGGSEERASSIVTEEKTLPANRRLPLKLKTYQKKRRTTHDARSTTQ